MEGQQRLLSMVCQISLKNVVLFHGDTSFWKNIFNCDSYIGEIHCDISMYTYIVTNLVHPFHYLIYRMLENVNLKGKLRHIKYGNKKFIEPIRSMATQKSQIIVTQNKCSQMA
jgi:hypothetical protein